MFGGWVRKFYSVFPEQPPRFKDLVTHPDIEHHEYISKLVGQFPKRTTLTALRLPNGDISIVEGMHRSCALALIARDNIPLLPDTEVLLPWPTGRSERCPNSAIGNRELKTSKERGRDMSKVKKKAVKEIEPWYIFIHEGMGTVVRFGIATQRCEPRLAGDAVNPDPVVQLPLESGFPDVRGLVVRFWNDLAKKRDRSAKRWLALREIAQICYEAGYKRGQRQREK